MGEDAQAKPQADSDGTFEVTVSADKLSAELKVTPPKPQGKPVTADGVMQKVSELGIKDVKSEAISKYLSDGNFVQPMVIAEGAPAVPGKDGSLQNFYLEKKGSKEDHHGNVDLRNVSTFNLVGQDEKLIRVTPPEPGRDGCTVLGEIIPFPPGKDMAPKKGKNVLVSPDGTEFTAAVAGLVVLRENEIAVDQVLKTEGDVDFDVGNINFDGMVIIGGAIMEGFTVQATGDVMAELISQGSVQSGGNVVINKGIIGTAKTFVKAKGNVQAKFIENATIDAGGNILVSESIMHSNVSAGGHIVVKGGKHCNLVGGTVRAAGSVQAQTIGSEASTKTLIEIGLDPALRAHASELEDRLTRQTDNHDKLKLSLGTLQKVRERGATLPPEKEALLKKLSEACEMLEKEIQDMKKEHAEIQNKLQHARPGTVNAKGEILPGVQISILNETMKINKRMASTGVYLDREKKQINYTNFKEVEI